MLSRFVAFTSLGRKALPNQYDLIALALIFAAFIAIAHVSHGMTLPLTAPESTVISLDYMLLPYYALRTTLRMFAAIAASLVFTFVYATLPPKAGAPGSSSFHCSTSCNRCRSSAFCRSR